MATKKTTSSCSNDERARDLLLWARRNRIMVGSIVVGDVQMTLTDMAQMPTLTAAPGPDQDRGPADAWETYGGAGLQRLRERSKLDQAVTEEEDDEPVADASDPE